MLVALSVLQVLYVRFFPPLFTLTMVSRKLEAARAGKPTEIRRQWIDLEDTSPSLIRAVLAGEDDRFYLHHGFDLEQIRKAWKHNKKGKRIRGASTLSQQTARNLFLWQHRSWFRKGLEAYYTVLLELLVPKERILELYLNVAEWGDRIFGVEAAARHYFRRSARDLSQAQAAALAASLPNPRKYPPDGSTRFQRRRQALILKRMKQPTGAPPLEALPEPGPEPALEPRPEPLSGPPSAPPAEPVPPAAPPSPPPAPP